MKTLVFSAPSLLSSGSLSSAVGRKNRSYVLTMMLNLPSAVTAADKEVVAFIEKRSLYGRGIGYIDTHLLASTALTSYARLWTMNTRLQKIVESMNLGIEI